MFENNVIGFPSSWRLDTVEAMEGVLCGVAKALWHSVSGRRAMARVALRREDMMVLLLVSLSCDSIMSSIMYGKSL